MLADAKTDDTIGIGINGVTACTRSKTFVAFSNIVVALLLFSRSRLRVAFRSLGPAVVSELELESELKLVERPRGWLLASDMGVEVKLDMKSDADAQ